MAHRSADALGIPEEWLLRTKIRDDAKLRRFARIALRDGAVCNHCGSEDDLTLDHVVPGAGNGDGNLQLLCRSCNSAKGTNEDDKTVRWSSAAFQAGFTMIPNVVLLDGSLTVYAHRIYSLLLHYARQDEACWPGQDGLAEKAACGERSVRSAIRELEDAKLLRTRRRGQGRTNIYILLAPRAARSADQEIPRPARRADQERQDVPILVEEDAVEEYAASRGTVVVSALRERVPAKVDRRPVSDPEAQLAVAVLEEWNGQTGQRLASGDWLSKIVMRVRERPDLDLAGHASVIAAALARPWWDGPPTPSVVYGNGAQFERCIVQVEQPAGPSAPDRTRVSPTGAQTATSLLEEAQRLASEGR